MVVFRGHVDGRVIVPNDPIELPPQAQAVVLIESIDPKTMNDLDTATREYYQTKTPPEPDDENWGQGLAHDQSQAWDQE